MANRTDLNRAKQRIREHVWNLLHREGATPASSVHGRIPYFTGAEAAARRLAEVPQWLTARVVMANPDWPQLPARVNALNAGKVVYMAVPRLADVRPFYRLDTAELRVPPDQAATPDVAATNAPKVHLGEMPSVDLVICGSVAVNRDGSRIGKGAGYSDIEVALLAQMGLLATNTVIATTVHNLQVIKELLPITSHDFTVDLIVTPDHVFTCRPSRCPTGLDWGDLTADKIASIPVLADLAAQNLDGDSLRPR
jgi:5-formyltetrahydrofolate cyclo-ligase